MKIFINIALLAAMIFCPGFSYAGAGGAEIRADKELDQKNRVVEYILKAMTEGM